MSKYYKKSILKIFASALLIFVLGCQRDLSELQEATYPKTGEIFIDDFVAMGSNFFFPFVGDGSKAEIFSVDRTQGYKSKASIRIDVPNANDPDGTFAGAAFLVDGIGRDLRSYNALTFYAKATQNVSIATLGFGESNHLVTIDNVPFTTNWVKYIIPIPNAAKLTNERGMFLFSAGTQNTNGLGYSFWIDELKFEKVGSISFESAAIENGTNRTITSFIGVNNKVEGLSVNFSMPNGARQAINASPYYFDFSSSKQDVAKVDAQGLVSTIAQGNTVITATLAGKPVAGSLTVNSNGNYVPAPTPTHAASNVISVFSNAYTNVKVDYYNGYWQPYQTTRSADFTVNGDNVLNYTNFNFVGIQASSPTINASSTSHFHMNLFIPKALPSGANFKVNIVDFGANGAYGGNDDTNHVTTITAPTLRGQSWISISIPFSQMSGLRSRNNIGQIIFEGTNISDFYADNIYFYNDGSVIPLSPTRAAPAPTHAANSVLSVFSDAYTNITGVDFNPNWGQSTTVSQLSIAGNNVLRYGGLNYQGTQFASPLNVSSYGYIHLDYYTANSTSLKFYLISSGPRETAYTLAVPSGVGTNSNGWKSVDIPLSAFSPVVLSNIIQFKVDGNGDVFFDNIYFHN